ncbi:MAG: AMP-binding protein [Armatimonadetes bacterium]|nr:AMP-binding protein [Armatimonadota bacterium]
MAGEFSLISDVLIKGKDKYGQKRAVQRKGPGGSYEGYSYDALYCASCGLAHKMLEIGFRKGDKVGILAENGATWAMAAFGTFFAGGAIVPLGVHNTPDEVSAILDDAEAGYLIVSQPFIENAIGNRACPSSPWEPKSPPIHRMGTREARMFPLPIPL